MFAFCSLWENNIHLFEHARPFKVIFVCQIALFALSFILTNFTEDKPILL